MTGAPGNGQDAPVLDRLGAALDPLGLLLRGGFHPQAADEIDFADGTPAGTLVLVGNAGPRFWQVFSGSGADLTARHPLDRWIESVLGPLAAGLGAEPVWPFGGPPWPPMLRWARRAGPVHVSPVGILVHPDFGLWHAYRAAFLFRDRLPLPARDDRPSPCDDCPERPCLSACPVDAFSPTATGSSGCGGYNSGACAAHIGAGAGCDCLARGCLARRACPVGREFIYHPDQARFHTERFLLGMSERGRSGRC